jgi:CubicO group peptidase (beta-lactamase class C family)
MKMTQSAVCRLLVAALFFHFAVHMLAQPLPITTPEDVGFSTERLRRLHAFVQKQVDAAKYSGAITLIARNGKIADWQAFGCRDLEARTPMEKDTIFRIYSMSKIITSVAVMMLFEEGCFGLEDPIGDYIPELKNLKVFKGGTVEKPEVVDAVRPITIKQLLTHTSGITYGWENSPAAQLYGRAKLDESVSLQEFVSKLGKLPLLHQPGEKWDYGYSVDVLGRLVEVVSGKTFEEFLEQRVFIPLGMKDTGFFVPEEKKSRLAKIYGRTGDGKLRESTKLFSVGSYRPGKGMPRGGAGIFSTIGDFTRLGQMLLNNGRFDGKQFLGRKTIELMLVNHVAHLDPPTISDPPGFGFGLGGSVVTDLAKTGMPGSIGNFGWSGYASTSIEVDFKEKCLLLFFFQHLPCDQDGILGKCSRLAYQALVD